MAKKDKFVAFDGSNPIKAKIRQRRSQMLIHSCLYYELDSSIVSDDQWQQWAEELEVLQKENSKFMKMDFFDREFSDWDGTTGSHLPHRHPWVYAKSKYILDIHEKMK